MIQFVGVVGAEDADVGRQVAQARQVLHALPVVGGDQALGEGQGARAVGAGGDLAVEPVGVPGVQEPALAGLHGHARVAARVAGQRDQRQAGQVVQGADGRQAEQGVAAAVVVGHPVDAVLPLPGAVSALVGRVGGAGGGGVLGGVQVDAGPGEVAQAARRGRRPGGSPRCRGRRGGHGPGRSPG